MLMTMSISRAPSRMARRASAALISGSVAPSGKPTTVQVSTGVPRRASLTVLVQQAFTQMERNRNLRASAHSASTCSRVASGFRIVWSM